MTAVFAEFFSNVCMCPQQIDNNVSIVPRGAYIVTPSHRVLKNPAYEGLSLLNKAAPLSKEGAHHAMAHHFADINPS